MKKILDNKIVWFMVIVTASPFMLLEKILRRTGVVSAVKGYSERKWKNKNKNLR